MAVLRFKANKLQKISYKGLVDKNGDYSKTDVRLGEDIACDAVGNGSAKERQFEDGVIRTYSFVCYLSPDCEHFEIGQRVKLSRGNINEIYEVKGFLRYQLQAKLWLG